MTDGKSERYAKGMATRREVLGDAWVEAAQARKTAFDEPFQDMITEGAWGHVWSRDAITRRERSMVTLALLAGLGNDDELALHARATVNTGCSREDIREVMLHVAVYAGVPRANHAIKVIRQVFDDIDGNKP